MYEQAEGSKENKTTTVAKYQKKSVSESAFQLVDNRVEAVAQRKVQEIDDNSTHVFQLSLTPNNIGHEVVQRFQAQIIASQDKEGHTVIADIKQSGRTPSPYSGTMGAHSTAWTVHVDGVRRQIQGKTLDGAITRITELLNEVANSPQALIAAKDNPFGPGGGFQSALAAAHKYSNNSYTGSDDVQKAQWLEDYIAAYLNALNHAPLSTVMSGNTKGDGESEPRNFLIQVESGRLKDVSLDLVRQNLARLFASDTPSAFIKDYSVNGFNSDDIWARALYGFIRGIKHAYPNAYRIAQLHDSNVMTDFLRSLSKEVPGDIANRLETFGENRVNPELPSGNLLRGGTGDDVGGDMAVQVKVGDKANISDIHFEGRTPSPFVGSMGAHSTAWVAHLDALRSALSGRSLIEAASILQALSNEAIRSPLLNMMPYILPDQSKLLIKTYNDLVFFVRVLTRQKANAILIKSLLQQTIAAYLAFLNALPLNTAEAADTTGRSEGYYRDILLQYERNELRDLKPDKTKKARISQGPLKVKDRVHQAFWKMYDANSAASFTDALYPMPVPSGKRVKRDTGYRLRERKSTGVPEQVEQENQDKKSIREESFKQKPLSEKEIQTRDTLHKNAADISAAGKSHLLPTALALNSFLHTMAQAYPRSYDNVWHCLSRSSQIKEIGAILENDGGEVLTLLDNIPSQSLVTPSSEYSFPEETEMSEEINYAEIADESLRGSETRNAERDGIANQYVIGHAQGRHNACLIYSLLRHALARDATDAEVDEIRDELSGAHPDIANNNTINIYSDTGHAVIETIYRRYNVRLNVAVVTTRDAPVVPVTAGDVPALLYLMPGHFVPCWRK